MNELIRGFKIVEEIEDTLRKAETYVKRKGHYQSLVKSTITIPVMT